MRATEFLKRLLQQYSAVIKKSDEDSISFVWWVSGAHRAGIVVTDSVSRTILRFALRSNVRKRDLQRVRRLVALSDTDRPFAGHLEYLGNCLFWKIDFYLCSNWEANEELFDRMLPYVQDDLGRVDLILHLEHGHQSNEEICRTVEALGPISGTA